MGRSRTLLALGAAWLAWIWVVAALSDRTWPWLEGPHNWSYDVERRATPLTRWDSGWYVGIAEGGYEAPPTRVGQETNHAFFPLYPLLMRGLSRGLGIETSLAGNLVSGTAFLLALLLFGGWVERHHGRERVLPAAAVLLLFPTSLFFAAVYTESLVLLLALATVVALERGRLVPALLAGYLAGLTRISGVVLSPYAFLVSLRESRARGPLRASAWARATAAGLAPLAGFGTFCLYHTFRFGDPLLFVRAQHNWAKSEKTILDGPVLIWNTIVEDVATGRVFHKSPARTLEGVFLLLFFVLAFVLLRQRRWAEAVFVGGSCLLVVFTGTLESAGRYVLPAFPGFAVLAGLPLAKRLRVPAIAAALLVQAAYVFVFVHWLWVG